LALTAGRPVDRALFTSGARENVVQGATEQTDDGIELLIPHDHIAGKIAFERKWWALAILVRSMRAPLWKLERARSRAEPHRRLFVGRTGQATLLVWTRVGHALALTASQALIRSQKISGMSPGFGSKARAIMVRVQHAISLGLHAVS
jgi:hypothetical protein